MQPSTNTSIVFTGPERIELKAIDSDLLPLGDHEILARTRYSLISAGTELACLSGVEDWFSFPGTPGYASVSEIIAVGREVSAAAPGDIVFSMGGHCQYQRIDAANPRALCVKVPADMDLSQAVFARMICVSFTALRISTIEVGDYVAVIGLGLVGNFAAQLAGLQGGRVIGLDHNEKRVELARECGVAHAMTLNAETVAADIAAITAGSDVTTLIEATGNPRALPMALPLVGRYGEIIMLGTPRGNYETDLTPILQQLHLDGCGNPTIKGAHEWRYPVPQDPFVKHSISRNAALALEYIRNGDLQVSPLHSHTLKPEQAQQAYDGLKHDKNEYIGVVFDWTGVPPTT